MASKSPSIWKQLAGAAIGAACGLLVYGSYTTATPLVQAWLSIPQENLENRSDEGAVVSDPTIDAREEERFQARAREIEREFTRNYAAYQPNSAANSSRAPAAESSPDATDASGSAPSSVHPSAAAMIDAGQPLGGKGKGGPAPDLPDSGVGAGMGMVIALATAGALRARRRASA